MCLLYFLRAHLLAKPSGPAPLLLSSFLILPLGLARCKVEIVVTFAIKRTPYDLLLYHISPEVHLNIRCLTSHNYTRPGVYLQEVFIIYFTDMKNDNHQVTKTPHSGGR